MVFTVLTEEMLLTKMTVVQAKTIEDVLAHLDEWQPDVIIMESFRLYPWTAKSLSWNQMLPSQVIGAVKAWTIGKNVEIIMQPASVRIISKPYTRRFEKLPIFKGKPHAKDAMRHIGYYLIKNCPQVLLKEVDT